MTSHRHSLLFECFQIGSLCLVWYSSSAVGNVIVKELLEVFPFPLTVTLAQLLSIWILCVPLMQVWKVPPPEYLHQNRIYYFKVIIPLAIGKFLAQLSSHVSLWKVPVSYSHTIKATMPLFTVVLSRLILREKQTSTIYLTLIPIVVGVVIASVTELSFNMTGLISALLSTFGFSLQNIYSKKAKYDQRRIQHKETILPLVRSEPNLTPLKHDDLSSSHTPSELTARHHGLLLESRPSNDTYGNQTFKDV
ncbi:unnamed protein product [Rotaria socialis]|uniref:Sugar phosphate transporter domain-containing protein n=1 Tax=Rotaria socialis TaxID=392032 RepID=A0A820ZMX3_9BILA|nr:unnamed protein product [Rotaria socialis]